MSAQNPAVALLATLALAGCIHNGSDGASRPSMPEQSGEAIVEAGSAVDAIWIAGDRAYGLGEGGAPEKLARPVVTNLLGTLSPAALVDPAGDVLAYNSWSRRRPVIRLRALATGKELVLDEGALSLAWRRDGALAYFKALQPDVREVRRYAGHVVVRRSRAARPVRWTAEPGRYVVAAWAGKRLLVYRVGAGWPELLVLDGPRRARVLARDGALVAVSPDGRRAFVATHGSSPPVVRVLDVAGRGVAARTPLRRGIRWVLESGSWDGDRVVAATGAGLAIFRVGPGSIRLKQVVRLPPSAFPTGLFEPRIEGDRLVAWGALAERPRQGIGPAAVVQCDRLRLRCLQGPAVASALGPHLVYNPSRP